MAQRSRGKWYLLSAVAIFVVSVILSAALQVGNAMDMKVFARIGLAFSLWTYLHDVPDSYANASCADLDLMYSSQHPIVFKGCIDPTFKIDDFVYFEDREQNVFPSCAYNFVREYDFESYDGSTAPITENIPCGNTTLREKLVKLAAHNISTEESYFEGHPYRMHGAETAAVMRDLVEKLVLPAGFEFRSSSAIHLVYIINAGTTTAHYLHSHPDYFLTFNIQGMKTWELVNPKWIDHFDWEWSGIGNVMLKEKRPAPRVLVELSPGDVLYMPGWWMHKTRVASTTKSFGVNLHGMNKGQIIGHLMSLYERFGYPKWFHHASYKKQGTRSRATWADGAT
eukprot:NODE_11433_length_1286_cov_9.635893.p1 GENE.NODE_11433_length_1286_cov_9.635893~~NODE_11433_length_1286_cov_9.635893.p1  ORF type:complete len:348 (+),score=46.15 NODE_11433_length_1286_cov_9.635893:28-1044(+)